MKARLPQGYGKQNINELMQQAQQIQENVKKKQDELEAQEYTVKAGGGMIELTMTGKHQVTIVKINPDAVQPDDVEMLEDLVAAAFNEAVRVVDETADTEMDKITGGLNLPGM
ncbi:MAG: YbaB/EbfC family nucleoid-associated protein [Oscillospiraceae bacterium]